MAEGDAAGGERIGVAWIDVEARLDKLRQDLAEAERLSNEQMRRLSDSAREPAEGVREVEKESSKLASTLASVGIQGFGAFKIVRMLERTIRPIRTIISLLGRVGRMLMGIPGLIILGVSQLGNIINILRDIPGTIARIKQAWEDIDWDGVRQQVGITVDEFARATPILAGMRKTINEISKILGGPDFIGKIEEAEAATERMTHRANAMRDAFQAIGDAMSGIAQEQRRAFRLEAADERERIVLGGEFEREDIEAEFRRRQSELSRQTAQRIRSLEEERGSRPDEQIEAEIQNLIDAEDRAMRALEEHRDQALEASTQRQRERLQQRADDLSRQNAEMVRRRLRESERLRSELAQTQLRIEGDSFAARAEAIRSRFGPMIEQAEREVASGRVRLLEELQDSRLELIRQQAREEAQARADAVRESLEGVERDITRQRILGSDTEDPETLARLFDVRERFAERMSEAGDALADVQERIASIESRPVSDRDRERLESLREQRDLLEQTRERLEQLREMESEEVLDRFGRDGTGGRQRAFRDVTRDRIQRGSGLADAQRIESPELEEAVQILNRIEENTQSEFR